MSGIELKYAPRECQYFVMGDCIISEYDKSCHIDCDNCDVYHYFKQLQACKEENERQHKLRLKSESDWDKREKQWVAEAEKAWKSQSSEYAQELEHTIKLRDEQIVSLTQQNKQMKGALDEIKKVFKNKHSVNGYEHTTLTIVRNVLKELEPLDK